MIIGDTEPYWLTVWFTDKKLNARKQIIPQAQWEQMQVHISSASQSFAVTLIPIRRNVLRMKENSTSTITKSY